MSVVSLQPVEIANLETRSKTRGEYVLGKDEKFSSNGEIVISNKLIGAKVQRRKRTGNGKKKKTMPRLHPEPDIPSTSTLPPIVEKGNSDDGNMNAHYKWKLLITGS